MTAEVLLQQIAPLADNDYFNFVRADTSLGPHAFSRAYINFRNHKDILIFQEKFDGYVFVDAKGGEYPAVVEFAPFLKVPKRKAKKADPRKGTIESDPDYLHFLEQLKNAEPEVVQPPEIFLEEIEARERELKASHGCPKVTTPLIDYIVKKRDEKRTAIINAREEKRKLELERRRQREDLERRRRLERDRERQREKERQRLREKEEKEREKERERRKKEEVPVISGPVTLLRNPEREKEEKDKQQQTGAIPKGAGNKESTDAKTSGRSEPSVRPKSYRDARESEKVVRDRERPRPDTHRAKDVERKKESPFREDGRDDSARMEKVMDVVEPKVFIRGGRQDQNTERGGTRDHNKDSNYKDKPREYNKDYDKERYKERDRERMSRDGNRDRIREGDRDKHRDGEKERYRDNDKEGYRDSERDRYKDSGKDRYRVGDRDKRKEPEREMASKNIESVPEPVVSRDTASKENPKEKEKQGGDVSLTEKCGDKETVTEEKYESQGLRGTRGARYQKPDYDQDAHGDSRGSARDRRHNKPEQKSRYDVAPTRGQGYRNRGMTFEGRRDYDRGYTPDDERPYSQRNSSARQSSDGGPNRSGGQRKYGEAEESKLSKTGSSLGKSATNDERISESPAKQTRKSEERELSDAKERTERADRQRLRYKDRPEKAIYNPARRAAERMKDGGSKEQSSVGADSPHPEEDRE